MHNVIILAAGSGTRFRENKHSRIHKSLAPIWDHRGTLPLLLTHLRALGLKCEQITLVTGFLSSEVLHEAQHIFPQLSHYFNANFDTDSMFNSLQKALKARPDTTKPFWVLFADTLYTAAALENMMKFQATLPAAAISAVSEQPAYLTAACASAPTTSPPKELGVTVTDNRITTFNTHAAQHTHVMAHAVFWPSNYVNIVLDAPATFVSQWQLLQTLPQVTYLALAPLSAQDIDTQEQLALLKPNIATSALDYFKQDLNKDQRSLYTPDRKEGTTNTQSSKSYYVKQCENPDAATHEAWVLTLLHNQFPGTVPQVHRQNGNVLVTDLINGIRLYDLLRHLQTQQPHHAAIRAILNARYNQHLGEQQHFLEKNRSKITQTPYPFTLKVSQLLIQLCVVLRLPMPSSDELATLEAHWNTFCTVPFRDATPKNIIINAPEVNVMQPATARHTALTQLLQKPLAYWEQLAIVDIDYTSTYHLTSPLDDQISYNGHACNMHNNPHFRALFEKQHNELERDLALFVRYLRFGGRKLMYLLINPTGYRHRFKYDDPTVYFRALPTLLSDNFKQHYPKLSDTLTQLNHHVARFKGVMPSEFATDYFLQSLDAHPRYWQESPLECNASQSTAMHLSN